MVCLGKGQFTGSIPGKCLSGFVSLPSVIRRAVYGAGCCLALATRFPRLEHKLTGGVSNDSRCVHRR